MSPFVSEFCTRPKRALLSLLRLLLSLFLRLASTALISRRLRFRFPDQRRHRVPNFRRALHRMNSRSAHRLVFVRRGSLSTADDGPRVSHPAPRRSSLTRDESHDGLLHMFLDELRRDFFRIAANFSDHHNRARPRIVVEHLNRVEK